MRIVVSTWRQRIKALPDHIAARFSHLPSWTESYGGKSQKQVYEELCALNLETCTSEDLRSVASWVPGWTRVICAGCRNSTTNDVVVFEEEADYDVEGFTVIMCRKCLVEGCSRLV